MLRLRYNQSQGADMNNRIKQLLGFEQTVKEPVSLGEDMVPSPNALDERSALSTETTTFNRKPSSGPFKSAAQAPLRDFTG